MVAAHKIELDKDSPNYNAVKAEAHLEQKVDKVSSKFPQIMNLYDSLDWSKSFNPALEDAKKEFKEILAEKNKQLAQVKA